MIGTGTIDGNGGTIGSLTINHAGTTTLASSVSVTATATTTLTSGALNLAGFTLTTGIFNSNANPSYARSIAFGSGNIVLVHPTTDTTVLQGESASNFTWTGTGGFTADASVARTYFFGTSGGSSTNAPNLTFTGSGTRVQTIVAGSWFNKLDFGTTAFNPGTVTLNLNGLSLSATGTYTNLSATIRGTGTLTGNGNATLASLVINTTSGTTTLGSAFTLTATGTFTLTSGALDLAGFTLTTGIFSSTNTNTRSVAFGSGSIVLAHTTAATLVLSMGTLNGMTFTGTGGFTAAANITRSFQVGSTSSNAATDTIFTHPNLTFTTGSAVQTITSCSFTKLDFGTTTFNPGTISIISLASLVLSSGGTYTGLTVTMKTTGTITPNGKTIAALTISHYGAGTGTTTLTGALGCTTYNQIAGTVDFATFNLTCSSTASYTAGTLTNTGTITCTTWTVTGTFTMTNGTITPSTSFVLTSGAFNYNGGTLSAVPTFTHTAGTVTLGQSYATTATGTYTLTAGTLNLNGFNLTTGIFSSSSSSTRSITFGTNNIVLAHTTAATTVLSMATANNFTWTGTGGFITDAAVTRTFTFGTTGGSITNAPNLSITSGAEVVTFTNGSWFDILDFTGSTTAPAMSASTIGIYVDTLTLASGGTYTGFIPVFIRTQTWTSQFSKELGGIGFNLVGGTLTLDNTQTYTATSSFILTAGTLNLGGYDLTIGLMRSTNSNTRSIAFGSNNIVLANTTAGTTVLLMANATGFTWTGTGGFRASAAVTRTFSFGSTGGGSATNAPNLTLTGSGTAVATLTSASWFNILDFGTTAFTIATTTLNLYSLTLSATGTYTNLTVTTVGTGIITTNGKTIFTFEVNCPGGTTTLGGALTTGTIRNVTLTSGTLDLAGFTLTTGEFSSSNSNTRSVAFGSANIVLVHTTSASSVLSVATATNFTWTGTGGFTTDASVSRTFTFGSTAGGSITNAPNLSITSGGAAPIFTDFSWFNSLNFTGSTFTLSGVSTNTRAVLNIDTLTLASGGTYLGLIPVFTRTQTWTPQFNKQLGGIGCNVTGVTLTLEGTQTYTATSYCYLLGGTLDLGGFDLNVGSFNSSLTGTVVRSIAFGSNNIVLTHTTAAFDVLACNSVGGFTWTGTGGFTADASVARSYSFGSSSGGSTSNPPNLTFTGSGVSVQTITSNSWFNKLDFGTTAFNPGTIALNLNSLTLSATGTYTSMTPTMVGTGTVITNGNTTLGAMVVNSTSGTTSLGAAATLAATGTFTLTSGALDLAGFTLTTGIFSSSGDSTRSISFGSSNIVLAHTTAATTVLSMANATGFTYTGTGGFTAAANITRTYTSGTTGGSITNNPNLTLTGSGTAIQTFTTGSWFNSLNFGTTAFNVPTTTLNLDSLTLSSGGTFTGLTATMVDTGTVTPNGKTVASLTINHAGTTTLAGAFGTAVTGTTTLTSGALDLAGFTLTTGIFSSNNSNTRSVAFGSGNIVLTHTSSGQTIISMATATGFTWTGTGGFTTTTAVTRTFSFGSTAGGSATNAPNLSITSGAAVPTITTSSWFKELNFTGTTSTPPSGIVYVDTLTLATGGTYSALVPIFTRTQTWTAQFSKQLGGIGVNIPGGTLTLDGTQTYIATSPCYVVAGTLDLGGANQTFGLLDSNTTLTRSIAFGSNNIILAHTTSAQTVLSVPDATNFTYTGTGGFTSEMLRTRTFSFGSTAGGSATNAPNLSLTSGASVPTITSGSWFKNLNFTGTTSTIPSINVYVDTLTLATGGTYSAMVPIFTRTQTWTAQFSKQLGGIGVRIPAGTLTLEGTQTYSTTSVCYVIEGTLDLGGANQTFGRLDSDTTLTRSIAFGSNNIILVQNTADFVVLSVPDATNFTYTGTGGFTSAMSVTRTFTFGTTGGSATNAPNLSLTSGASVPTITTGSWFKALNFTGTTSTLPTTTVNVDTLTLATGGTYTGLTPIFTRTQTWTPQFSKILAGIGVNTYSVTLTLESTQIYAADSTLYLNGGTLNISTADLSFYNFSSTGTGSRSITGTGSINISNNWTVTSGSGFTGSDYYIKMSKSTAKTFAGGDGNYGTLVQQTTSQLTITGSNTFEDIQVNNNMVAGQQEFTTTGTYSWTAPTGVTAVSVVAVGGGGGGRQSASGGGGGGGAGLGWKNNIPVTPGQSYTVVVGTGGPINTNGTSSYFIDTVIVAGLNGSTTTGNAGGVGGSYVGDGGGNGGNGGTGTTNAAGGGGGAGGYTGNGGAGGSHNSGSPTPGANGTGGGGGGAGYGGGSSGGGGGVGLLGEGSNGVGSPAVTGSTASSQGGSGGSGGTSGIIGGATTGLGFGGSYGGGGGSTELSGTGSGTAGSGAVRIIWGPGRAFPSTNTGNV
jgi:hypothetical protein